MFVERIKMEKHNFQNIIREVAEKNPIIFALEPDARAEAQRIDDVEKYYEVTLPDSYKDFASQYGGGYFGFIVVYSCDCNGAFYIKKNVLKEWVLEKSFLPVVDLETGDFIGFEIKDGICQNMVALYSHEEGDVRKMEVDFYEALLIYGLKYSE